jgi:beta-lactamase regulating signal transducer with metallopeptidase domain
MFNPALILVGALFFLGASAAFYVGTWLLVALILRRFPGISPRRAKKLLFAALVLPAVTAGILTGGGAFLRHIHTFGREHHSALCGQVFYFLSTPETRMPSVTGEAIKGAAWLLLALGGIGILRLLWATFSLERGLEPYLLDPSARLTAAIERVRERLNFGILRFFECDIPMAYSSLLGLHHVRCVLSRKLVAESTEAELEAIVAHEASHLRAGDVMGTFLVGALNCLFFFLRPVRLLARRWREQTELTCDAAAAQATGKPLALASAILRAQGVPVRAASLPAVALALAEEKSCATEMRVRCLLAYAERTSFPVDTPRSGLWQWVVTGVLAVFGLLALSSPTALCTAHCTLEAVERLLH